MQKPWDRSPARSPIETAIEKPSNCVMFQVFDRDGDLAPRLEDLARNIHEGPTAAVHLRTLEREIDVRLLDVLPSTSLGGALRKESECADFSSQSTHLHALATDPHE